MGTTVTPCPPGAPRGHRRITSVGSGGATPWALASTGMAAASEGAEWIASSPRMSKGKSG